MPFTRYTLTRISRDLGVSLTTVSRALNGTGRLAPETRRRIQEYAESLQQTAPAEAAERQKMVGLYTPWYSTSYGMRTTIVVAGEEAVRSVCEEKGYAVLFSSFGNPDQPTVGDKMLASGALSGLLLYRTQNEPELVANLNGLPYVVVHRNLEGSGLNYVGIDFAEAVQLATYHCLDLGYRDIALLTGSVSYPSNKAFHAAFRKMLEEASLPLVPEWMIDVQVSEEQGYAAAMKLLKKNAPRAIVCGSDRLAFGVLSAAHDLGCRVPGDLAVATIDGTLQTAYTRPSLTAVEIPWSRMFGLSAKLLLEMIESPEPIGRLGISLRCRLVVRESTAGSRACGIQPAP